LLNALFAPAKASVGQELVASFAEFRLFHDARLGLLGLNPACLKEGLTAFCGFPFPDWFAVACFTALSGISIKWGEGY
jgi:hypothetical protein